MKWLSLAAAIIGFLANLTGLMRDRRSRQSGRDAAIAAGNRDVAERAGRAAAAAAAARADALRGGVAGDDAGGLPDDGHRRD